MLEHLNNANTAASHEIAYVEARSAFARLARDGHLGQTEFNQVKAEFEADLPRYSAVGSDSELLRRAANMAEAFALSPSYSPPFRREGSPGPVAAGFCDRAHRKRTCLSGEDARPSKTPQTRGLAAPQ